jgi:hypothetical protein
MSIKLIQPMLTDMNLLSEECREKLNPLFDSDTIGLEAILINHYAGSSELVATAPNNYFFRDAEGSLTFTTWKKMCLRHEDACQFADAMLVLADEMHIPEQIRDISRNYGSLPENNYLALVVLRNSLILSHGDLDGYVATCPHSTRTKFSTIDTRASVCTVLAAPDLSNHGRLTQIERLRADLKTFRKINSVFFDALAADHEFDLGDFSYEDASAFRSVR